MTMQGQLWLDAYPDLGPVVVARDRIARRVEELSLRIADRFAGREVTILAVLTGSLVFLADLIRHLPLCVRVSLVGVRSYPGRATRSQGVRITQPDLEDLAGRHVLVVDDILDGGGTLAALLHRAGRMSPASLASCVLLRKRRDDLPDRVPADYVGFDIPDEFVVGYGLDFDDRYRNLPDVRVLRRAGQPCNVPVARDADGASPGPAEGDAP